LASVNRQNETIREIVEREWKKLNNFIRRRVSSEADAEDILQEVLYQFTAAMREDPIEKAASWLFKTAGNKIIDWYRKIKPASLDRLNEFSGDEFDSPSLPLEDAAFEDTNSAEILFQRSEFWPMLEEILGELPENQREAFIMHELEQKSFREISEITGAGINTLISRKRYAVLHLQKRLEDLYEDL
jgi:RNA polymerase sigma factor (sigma-70 family)